MNTQLLEKSFARMGARVKVRDDVPDISRSGIDIGVDREGEYFEISVRQFDPVEYEVIDLQPKTKHLLLMARRETSKHKFLCGHDERHWFVCAVPGESVSSVVMAMEALQPNEVRTEVNRRVKRARHRLRRKNKAFVRQGEWFFLPVQTLTVDPKLILRNERLSRGYGKPHMCEFAFREGGEVVFVCGRYPHGVGVDRYRELLLTVDGAGAWNWGQMMRNPAVYVKGRIWHPDHKTIVLNKWHRVFMNTEAVAPGAKSVVFLD